MVLAKAGLECPPMYPEVALSNAAVTCQDLFLNSQCPFIQSS